MFEIFATVHEAARADFDEKKAIGYIERMVGDSYNSEIFEGGAGMVFNATFNNTCISWWSVLLVEKTKWSTR